NPRAECAEKSFRTSENKRGRTAKEVRPYARSIHLRRTPAWRFCSRYRPDNHDSPKRTQHSRSNRFSKNRRGKRFNDGRSDRNLRQAIERAWHKTRLLVMATENKKILGFVGSLRAGSYNRMLLNAFSENLPAGASLEIAEIGNLPLYNTDLENNFPPVAQA